MANGIVFLDFGDTLVEIDPRLREEAVQRIQACTGHIITVADLKRAEREEWRRQTPDSFLWVQTQEDEENYWQGFYRAVLDRLGVVSYPPALLKWLALVPVNPESFVLFPDVRPVLDMLQGRGVALGIISNSFPSAERIFHYLELAPYFRYLVWSHQCGCAKPEVEIFRKALNQVNYREAQIWFVDDRPDFVKGANRAGFQFAFWINRNGYSHPEDKMRQIHTLWELVPVVESGLAGGDLLGGGQR